MKMFLLGMLVMWVLLSGVFFLLDCFKLDLWDNDRAYLRWLFLPIYLVAIIGENWHGFVTVIKTLDLCVKYKINPFYISITKISQKLSTKDKEIFIKRICGKDERLAGKWRKALDI